MIVLSLLDLIISEIYDDTLGLWNEYTSVIDKNWVIVGGKHSFSIVNIDNFVMFFLWKERKNTNPEAGDEILFSSNSFIVLCQKIR